MQKLSSSSAFQCLNLLNSRWWNVSRKLILQVDIECIQSTQSNRRVSCRSECFPHHLNSQHPSSQQQLVSLCPFPSHKLCHIQLLLPAPCSVSNDPNLKEKLRHSFLLLPGEGEEASWGLQMSPPSSYGYDKFILARGLWMDMRNVTIGSWHSPVSRACEGSKEEPGHDGICLFASKHCLLTFPPSGQKECRCRRSEEQPPEGVWVEWCCLRPPARMILQSRSCKQDQPGHSHESKTTTTTSI